MHDLDTWQFLNAIARAGSIRKAAESLAITSTALNRRVLALEQELGVPIFERLPRGVRLSTAGELLVAHVRTQAAELERLKSRIADLSGERTGHVGIACSQALLPFFLPREIAAYRRSHKAVTFAVRLRDRAAAEQSLMDFSADIALVFEPSRLREVQVLSAIRQPIHAVLARDHPLADRPMLRLSAISEFPVALPTASYGVRHLIDLALMRSTCTLRVALESDSFEFLRRYPGLEEIVGFQIPIGLPPDGASDGIVSRPIDPRDVPPGTLYLCQLRGRTLPVAAAKFTMQVKQALEEGFEGAPVD
jgi:DNA-binding transcriptional LysR family regulator